MAGIRGKKQRKPAKAARRATRKRVKESSKTASKPAAKKPKKTARTLVKTPAKVLENAAVRGAKSARDGASLRASKPARKAAAPRSTTRPDPGGRPLLTSVRRPKAEKTRGPARARVETRRRGPKQAAATGASGAAGQYEIRDFAPQDAEAVNALALAAFEQYRAAYSDWQEFAKRIGAMASLVESGAEIIVASNDGGVAGAVAYFGPGAPKEEPFDPAWSLIRLAVVDPAARGHGLGRLLTEECIRRARRDGAAVIALHTSPIMQVALGMYLRLGFVLLRQVPPRFGVPYRIYLKRL